MNELKRMSPKQRLALAAVLAVGLYFMLRGRFSATGIDGSLTPPGVTTDATGAPLDTGGGGTVGGGDLSAISDALGQQGELVAALQSRLDDQGQALADIGQGISDLGTGLGDLPAAIASGLIDPTTGLPYGAASDQLTLPPDTISDPFTPPDVGPSGQTSPAAPGNAKATSGGGFFWNVGGRRTYVTKQNREAFLDELRRHGVNPAEWAAEHPAAASVIGIGSAGPFVPTSRTPPRVVPPRPSISRVPDFGHVRPDDRAGLHGIGSIVSHAINGGSRSLQAVSHASAVRVNVSRPAPRHVSQSLVRQALSGGLSGATAAAAKVKKAPPPAPVHLRYL